MFTPAPRVRGLLCVALLLGASAVGCSQGSSVAEAAEQTAPTGFEVDGKIALVSLMSLSDNRLVKMADSLKTLARMPEVQSAQWDRVRPQLEFVAKQNVAALNWFALPDGSYWSLQEGKAEGNLSDRSYWPGVTGGQTILGTLVVSKATGRSVAIVAVPVTGAEGKLVGVLGASVYLEDLEVRLKEEMNLDDELHLFYSFDAEPLIALHSDPTVIFADPRQLGEEVSKTFDDMLAREEGFESYSFRGQQRLVLFKKSNVTQWWYAFGVFP